jgi:hypothetical protein
MQNETPEIIAAREVHARALDKFRAAEVAFSAAANAYWDERARGFRHPADPDYFATFNACENAKAAESSALLDAVAARLALKALIRCSGE